MSGVAPRNSTARAKFVGKDYSDQIGKWPEGYRDDLDGSDPFVFAGEIAGVGVFVRTGDAHDEAVDFWKDRQLLFSLTYAETRALAAMLAGPK